MEDQDAQDLEVEGKSAWFFHNPTWFWRGKQVHEVLTLVNHVWSTNLDLPCYNPPGLLPRRSVKGLVNTQKQDHLQEARDHIRAVREHAIRSRRLQLRSAPCDLACSLRQRLLLFTSVEQQLHAAILLRALRDYAQGITVPIPKAQRLALNAYWWFMGLPLLLTPKVRESLRRYHGKRLIDAPALQDLAQGRTRSWKSRGSLLFRDTEITRDSLFVPSQAPYYPPPWSAWNKLGHLTRMESCCQICGLDPVRVRIALHLTPPEEGDLFEDEDEADDG